MDVPRDPETYLHRIGRAGRFGESVTVKKWETCRMQPLSYECTREIAKPSVSLAS